MDVSVFIDDVKFNFRVGLLVKKENQILIECNPKDEHVTIPGGRVKTLENGCEALRREIMEEMHVDIKNDKLNMIAFFENFFEYDNKKYHELYLLYKININKDDERFNVTTNYDNKINHYKWVDIDNIDSVKILPEPIKGIVNSDSFHHFMINDLR